MTAAAQATREGGQVRRIGIYRGLNKKYIEDIGARFSPTKKEVTNT